VHGRLEVERGIGGAQIGRRIADHFEIVEVTVRVPRLALGHVANQPGAVGVTFHVDDLREIEEAAVCLTLAGRRP
jgi:hypothetical protein